MDPPPARLAINRGALQDRVLSVPVTNIALCPCMDLVALVLSSKSIIVQRVSWQRLFTLAPLHDAEPHISSLAWKPDGKILAAGGKDGTVAFYRIGMERMKPGEKHRDRAQGSGCQIKRIATKRNITSLWWSRWVERATRKVFHPEVRDLTMLFIGDQNGGVTLMTDEGCLTVGRIEMLGPNEWIENISAGEDMDSCAVAGYERGTGSVSFGTADLSRLSETRAQLWRLGAEVAVTSKMIDQLQGSYRKLKKHWIQGANSTLHQKVLMPLKKLMEAHGETSYESGWEYLWSAFSGAVPEDALMQFLGKELSGSGAKSLQREYRNASAGVYTEILRVLIPTAESFVYRASVYRGVLRMKDHSSATGIGVQSLTKIFSLAERLLSSSVTLACQFEEINERNSSFFEWLVAAVNQAIGERDVPPAHRMMTPEGAYRIASFFKEAVENEKANSEDTVSHMVDHEIFPLINDLRRSLKVLRSAHLQRLLPQKVSKIALRINVLSRGVFPYPMYCCQSEARHGAMFVMITDSRDIMVTKKGAQEQWTYTYMKMKKPVMDVKYFSHEVLAVLCCVQPKSPGNQKSFEKRLRLCKVPSPARVVLKCGDNSGVIEVPPSSGVSPEILADIPCTKTKAVTDSLLAVEAKQGLAGVIVGNRRVCLMSLPKRSAESVS